MTLTTSQHPPSESVGLEEGKERPVEYRKRITHREIGGWCGTDQVTEVAATTTTGVDDCCRRLTGATPGHLRSGFAAADKKLRGPDATIIQIFHGADTVKSTA